LAESRLTSLQRAVLEAFFRRERGFFLSGGGALAGFYLGHRETHDLDLFTVEPILDRGGTALRDVADELGATVERLQTSPDFQRWLVCREEEGVVVDLVRERVPQLHGTKRSAGAVLVDPPEEILANKLCTLLSRAEIRDLVDVMALERAGYRVDDQIAGANRKDGGFTPAQLGWVLGGLEIGDEAQLPGGVSAADLRAYVTELRARLARIAFPIG